MTLKTKNANENSSQLAVVLVRGMVSVTVKIKDTLKMLRLTHKNYCVVINNNSVSRGMVKKVKDYVTWGEISNDTFKQLVEQRGILYQGPTEDSKKKYTYKTLEFGGKKYKPYFRLNPPRKGFGRKGMKIPFNSGGGLGYRADKINDLIRRML